MNITTVELRIYVACLASYNAGKLHGEWIDANQSAEEIGEEVATMLKESPEPNAEEWAIHDYEGFGDLMLSEHESFETIASIAERVEKHGEPWLAYVGEVGLMYADEFEDAYCGEWDSFKDYVEEAARSCHTIPEWLDYYIDWEGMAEAWRQDYLTSDTDKSTVYVFRR
ncbi:hypothetical protein LCGC14_2011310 [marine sediment metagenome]|uniref:Antirestriction protein n=1 Tax=marine sediment metagenome TaxID=412755 RepID=A0A0F9F097_9ZZZZ